MSKTIANLLQSFFSKDYHWKLKLIKQWPEIAGKIHTYTNIEYISQNMVTISVKNSCLLQELYHLSPLLISKINQALDEPRITNVQFRLQSTKKTLKKQEANPEIKIEKKIPPLKPQEQKAISAVADLELQNILLQFRKKCY